GEVPALEGAGTEVLDQYVGIGEDALEQLLTFRGGQVDRCRALVAGQDLPPQANTILGVSVPAGRVAASRVFDLDHVGTEVAHAHGCRRAREQRRDVHDLDSGEWIHRMHLIKCILAVKALFSPSGRPFRLTRSDARLL